jgi:hypothetical protein
MHVQASSMALIQRYLPVFDGFTRAQGVTPSERLQVMLRGCRAYRREKQLPLLSGRQLLIAVHPHFDLLAQRKC